MKQDSQGTQKLKHNINELEVQLTEMKLFNQNADENREKLKDQIKVANDKIQGLEEELYEAKTS